MKKLFKISGWLVLVMFVTFSFLYLNSGPRPKKIDYGVSFSQPYAENLGLNWKEVLTQSMRELPLKKWRISAYWDIVEPKQNEYNFSDLDFMLAEAEKNNIQVTLAVGRRLPRWPECHEPEWFKKLSKESQENALMSYIETVVRKYSSNQAVAVWQVENEPFLNGFGICPDADPKLLDKEIALVKKIDPVRPILITDSGELSFWIHSGSRGDMFGTTMYRYVFSDVFNRYWINYIPFWFYKVKAGLLKLLNPGKNVAIIELQAEPWTTRGITKTSIEEQFKTMSMEKFEKMLDVANATGLSPQYLWGVEWWYWMKTKNHPEFWEKIQSLNN